MRQSHRGLPHGTMNQLQLLVKFSTVSVTSILAALTVSYICTLLLPSGQTHDYENADHNALKYFSSPTARIHNAFTCSKDSYGYCQNGGKCFIVEDGVKACQCPGPCGGERCEKHLCYHWIHFRQSHHEKWSTLWYNANE